MSGASPTQRRMVEGTHVGHYDMTCGAPGASGINGGWRGGGAMM
jgi:hypothetical protein